jgi:hypothetical protein
MIFDVIPTITMKMAVVWDMTSCSLVDIYGHFGGNNFMKELYCRR